MHRAGSTELQSCSAGSGLAWKTSCKDKIGRSLARIFNIIWKQLIWCQTPTLPYLKIESEALRLSDEGFFCLFFVLHNLEESRQWLPFSFIFGNDQKYPFRQYVIQLWTQHLFYYFYTDLWGSSRTYKSCPVPRTAYITQEGALHLLMLRWILKALLICLLGLKTSSPFKALCQKRTLWCLRSVQMAYTPLVRCRAQVDGECNCFLCGMFPALPIFWYKKAECRGRENIVLKKHRSG